MSLDYLHKLATAKPANLNVRFAAIGPGVGDVTEQDVRNIILAGLSCEHIVVEGDGRHWFATIVSSEFEGKRLIQRHQRVYATLGDRMQKDEVHALSMKTFTPAEWAARSETAP